MILMNHAMMGAAGYQAAGGSTGTQLYRDFDDDPLEQVPSWLVSRWSTPHSDWRVLESSVGSLPPAFGPRAFYTASNDASYRRAAFEITDAVGTEADSIGCLLRTSNTPNCIAHLTLRGAGANEASRSGYSLWVRAGTNNFIIRRTASGTEQTLATGTLDMSAGTDFIANLSATANGGSVDLAASAYLLGDESSVVTLSATDPSPLALGWPGIGIVSSTAISNLVRWGWIGVGTDGASAPMEPI